LPEEEANQIPNKKTIKAAENSLFRYSPAAHTNFSDRYTHSFSMHHFLFWLLLIKNKITIVAV